MKKICSIILLVFFIYACDEVPDPTFTNFVVEAYVFTGEPVHDITIKSLVPLSEPEGESEVIKDAFVTIRKEDRSFSLLYNSSTEKYETNANDLVILPQDVLDIEIEVNGRVATASTIVPAIPTGVQSSKDQMVIPEIKSGADFLTGDPLADAEIIVTWSNPDKELFYTVIEFRSDVLIPIFTTGCARGCR
jgi:hypothetical protein